MDRPIRIIHRDYIIQGVDHFTQDYMKKELDREMTLYQPVTKEEHQEPILEIPPHNGFGDEEDSRANCFRLILKPPKQDPRRLLLEETKLTFAIQLYNPKIEDKERWGFWCILLDYFIRDLWSYKVCGCNKKDGLF